MKNAFYGLISRVDMAKERISKLAKISIISRNTKLKCKEGKQKMEKREHDTQELWDSYKKCSIHIVGLPQKKEKKYLKQYKD